MEKKEKKKDRHDSSKRNKAAEYGKKLKKIRVTRFHNDLIYEHRPYIINNDNDDLVKVENLKIDENKMKNEMNEFNEIQKKREYLLLQVNAFKDDILK